MALPPVREAAQTSRRLAERAGRRAELAAAVYYFFTGFKILDRRFRAGGGEIDLIAKRSKLLVFAEVKQRQSIDLAIEAVTWRNRRRIEQAGRVFLSQNPHLAELGLRYDIVAVAGLAVHRLQDAWREGE